MFSSNPGTISANLVNPSLMCCRRRCSEAMWLLRFCSSVNKLINRLVLRPWPAFLRSVVSSIPGAEGIGEEEGEVEFLRYLYGVSTTEGSSFNLFFDCALTGECVSDDEDGNEECMGKNGEHVGGGLVGMVIPGHSSPPVIVQSSPPTLTNGSSEQDIRDGLIPPLPPPLSLAAARYVSGYCCGFIQSSLVPSSEDEEKPQDSSNRRKKKSENKFSSCWEKSEVMASFDRSRVECEMNACEHVIPETSQPYVHMVFAHVFDD